MKIAVAGTGYVGLSLAVLLSQNNEVTAVDLLQEKVDLINKRKSPIVDKEIEAYLADEKLDLKATLDGRAAYAEAVKHTKNTAAPKFFLTSAPRFSYGF